MTPPFFGEKEDDIIFNKMEDDPNFLIIEVIEAIPIKQEHAQGWTRYWVTVLKWNISGNFIKELCRYLKGNIG